MIDKKYKTKSKRICVKSGKKKDSSLY